MSHAGIVRFIEIGAYGERSGRQLLIKAGASQPAPADGAEWRIDLTFNAGDEILKSSGFRDVIAAVLKDGYAIVA
jgi:hypothetical protein